MYAYLQENIVRELIPMSRAVLEYYYPPAFTERCVECGEEVQAGFVYDGTVFAPPPGPAPDEILAGFVAAIQQRLDDFARSEGKAYDNMLSLCTYATSTNPVFALEGQYGVQARDATWDTANAVMNAVMAGQRPVPTWEDLAAELPPLVWPVASVE